MAVTLVTDNYTLVSDCNNTTSGGTWTGDYNAVLQETDFFLYGTACVGFTCRQVKAYDFYFTPTTAMNFVTNSSVIRMRFFSYNVFSSSVPLRMYISDGTNTAYWNIYAAGSDYPGGWQTLLIDTDTSPDSGTKPTNMASVTRVGLTFTTTAGTKNAPATFIDHIHQMDGIRVYGDKGTGIPFGIDDIYQAQNTTSTAYGLIQLYKDTYFCNGKITIGDSVGTNVTTYKDEDRIISFEDLPATSTTHQLRVTDNATATSSVIFSRCTIKSANQDSVSVFGGAAETNMPDTFLVDGCQFVNMYPGFTSTVTSTTTVTNNAFSDCAAIILRQGATTVFKDNKIVNYSGTTGGLLWDSLSNLVLAASSGLQFVSCTRGVEINYLNNLIYNFNNWTFVNTTWHVNNTQGQAITVNNLNGSNASTSTGSAVTFVDQPVTLSVTAKDQSTKAAIEGAAVSVFAGTGGTAPFFYQASVTITQTSGTATVSHTAHGLSTGDKVLIEGANQNNYNRIKTITVTGANAYTYPVDSGTVSPATGTITSTRVLIDELTNASGIVSDTFVLSTDLAITGYVAKGTRSPRYIRAPIADTIDSENGLSATVLMVSDE